MAEADFNTQIVCRVCGESKQFESFPKMRTGKYGRTTRCKQCTAVYLKEYQAANRDKLKAYHAERYAEKKPEYSAASKATYEKNKDRALLQAKEWAAANKEKRREIAKAYVQRNPEKRYETQKNNRLSNPGLYRAHFKKRQQLQRKAMPQWADEAAIRAIYEECARRSKETGVKHHVDHYYPLQNELVCGLHCEYNLRIITAFENLSKGNSFPSEEL